MSDEEWKAFQTLAADNARLCGIVIAADKLVEEVLCAIDDYDNKHTAGLEEALEAYKISRQGH